MGKISPLEWNKQIILYSIVFEILFLNKTIHNSHECQIFFIERNWHHKNTFKNFCTFQCETKIFIAHKKKVTINGGKMLVY